MKIIRQKRPEEWRVGMTIREAGKGIVTTGGGTYRIGFINTDGQEDDEINRYHIACGFGSHPVHAFHVRQIEVVTS